MERGRKSPDRKRRPYVSPETARRKKFLAALAVPTVVAIGGTAFAHHEQTDHAERYNAELHGNVVRVLEQLGTQDSMPGVAIVNGKTVTFRSMAKDKNEAMTTIQSYFSGNESVQVRPGQTPGEALWAEFSSDSYNPDGLLPARDFTLDQSEQVIMSILHEQNGETSPNVSRQLLSDVTELGNAMKNGDSTVTQLEDRLEHKVKTLADVTFAGQTDISVPNSQNF